MELLIDWMHQNTVLKLTIICILIYILWLQNFRKDLRINWIAVVIISTVHAIVGLLATRMLAIIEVGGNISQAANMRLFGEIFLMPLLYVLSEIIFHRDRNFLADIGAMLVVIGFIFGRINCLIWGCCKGALIPGSNTLHWPLREIEFIYYAFFLIYYARKVLQRKTYGELYPIFMIQYGLIRFILEWFRIEFTTQVGVFHLAHIWCILSVVIGILWLLILRKNEAKAIS